MHPEKLTSRNTRSHRCAERRSRFVHELRTLAVAPEHNFSTGALAGGGVNEAGHSCAASRVAAFEVAYFVEGNEYVYL